MARSNGPDRAGYWEAMKVEISTLTKLKAMEVVPLKSNMNFLDSTWAFKCSLFHYGILGSSRLDSVVEETRV